MNVSADACRAYAMATNDYEPGGMGKVDLIAWVQAKRRGVLYNVCAVLIAQILSAGAALALLSLGFSEATVVIAYVLGVLLTAVLTTSVPYCLVAAICSILSFNYFCVQPRFSLRIEGSDVPGTMAVMFVVALVASTLVMRARESVLQSWEARMLAQNEQLRSDLLRSVSHDFRTPLTSISGNADMLLDKDVTLTVDDRDRLAKSIRDDATWLTGMVENLLLITRLENGKVELSCEPVLVDDVVEEALRHVRRDRGARTIEFLSSNDLLFVCADIYLIVQVVVNLVNNAITYAGEDAHIAIGAQRSGDMVKVWVADDGPGVSPALLEHLFEPSPRANDAVADGRRGFGLGLSLCRSIVDAHGGSIRYEQVDPHGAKFAFALPAWEVATYE